MRISTFLRHTYVFWAAVSLLNFSVLYFLALPFLLPVAAHRLLGLLPFLAVPLALGLSAAGTCTALAGKAFQRGCGGFSVAVLRTYLFNGVFLFVFLLAADLCKDVAIAARLKDRRPECVHVDSFLASLRHAGNDFQFHAHALFRENGRTYYWSYTDMRFFEGNPRLDRNFSCTSAAVQ